MSTDFCYLEKDDKTYKYVLRYVKFIEEHRETILGLDNQVQVEEILLHMDDKKIAKTNIDDTNEEMACWIKKNSKPFRNYLNSIKVAAMILYSMEMNHLCEGPTSYGVYCKIVDSMNKVKIQLMDTVF